MSPESRPSLIRESVERIGEFLLNLDKKTQEKIDEQFLTIAEGHMGGIFGVISLEDIDRNRPDAIKHQVTFLPPKGLRDKDKYEPLKLVNPLAGANSEDILSAFKDQAEKLEIFDHLEGTLNKPGRKLLVVSNHLELHDQGLTLGFWQKAAMEQGITRLENHITLILGRLIGYFTLEDKSVVDDLLRPNASILKTFPSSGGESLGSNSHNTTKRVSEFMTICNYLTKREFERLLSSNDGRIFCLAGSGAQDKYDPKQGAIRMGKFGSGTCKMMIDACKQGASILPLFADYGPDASIVEFLEPRKVLTEEECHAIGEKIAAVGSMKRGIASERYPDIDRFKQSIVYSC